MACAKYENKIDGECGNELNTCLSGIFNDLPDTDEQYQWECKGENGGRNAFCPKDKPQALNCCSVLPANAHKVVDGELDLNKDGGCYFKEDGPQEDCVYINNTQWYYADRYGNCVDQLSATHKCSDSRENGGLLQKQCELLPHIERGSVGEQMDKKVFQCDDGYHLGEDGCSCVKDTPNTLCTNTIGGCITGATRTPSHILQIQNATWTCSMSGVNEVCKCMQTYQYCPTGWKERGGKCIYEPKVCLVWKQGNSDRRNANKDECLDGLITTALPTEISGRLLQFGVNGHVNLTIDNASIYPDPAQGNNGLVYYFANTTLAEQNNNVGPECNIKDFNVITYPQGFGWLGANNYGYGKADGCQFIPDNTDGGYRYTCNNPQETNMCTKIINAGYPECTLERNGL